MLHCWQVKMKPKVIHHVRDVGGDICSCGLPVGPATEFAYVASHATCQTCRNENGLDRINNRVVPLVHYLRPRMVSRSLCLRRSGGMRMSTRKEDVTCARCKQLLGYL